MKKTIDKNIKRRRFLQGSGATVALPFLELYATPAQACGAVNPRFIAIYMANGVTRNDFWSVQGGNGSNYNKRYLDWVKNGKNKSPITRSGGDWTPNKIVKPFVDKGLKNKIAMYGHLSNNALASSNQNGVHAAAACCYLTCQGALNKSNPQMGGQSFDHFLGEHYKDSTSLKSMNLSSVIKNGSGNGSNVVYSNIISWNGSGKPVQTYVSPRDAFKKYFGNAGVLNMPSQGGGVENLDLSVLDFVIDDASALRSKLGQDDKNRLDEYLTSLREMEESINNINDGGEPPTLQCEIPSTDYPHYVTVGKDSKPPGGYDRPKHMDMNFEMMNLALKCGLTNVATYIIEGERAEFIYPNSISGVGSNYHSMSHTRPANFARVNTFLYSEIADFLKKLDSVQESNGLSILDNSVVMAGSGMAGPVYFDKNRREDGIPIDDHQRHCLPIVFAGSGGGKLKTNQEVCMPAATRYANVFETLNRNVYCTADKKFANSNGVLNEMLL